MTYLSAELIRHDNVWTLKLSGSISSNTAQFMWGNHNSPSSLLSEMAQAQVKRLMIDLSGVDFIDSHGFRVFLNAHRDFSNKNVQLILLKPSPHLKRLFRIMQFDRILVVESEE